MPRPVCPRLPVQYALFDLTEPSTFRVHIAASPSTPSSKSGESPGPSNPAPLALEACLVHATSVPEAVSEFSRFNGRMAPLPQWVGQGAIVGLQGGTEVVGTPPLRLKRIQTFPLHFDQVHRTSAPRPF
jgi:hypothetical protein